MHHPDTVRRVPAPDARRHLIPCQSIHVPQGDYLPEQAVVYRLNVFVDFHNQVDQVINPPLQFFLQPLYFPAIIGQPSDDVCLFRCMDAPRRSRAPCL